MESFAQSSSDGNVFIANGIDSVLVWDGLSTNAVPAGVIAPFLPVILSSSGVGAITGTYFGWVRFIDDRGNLSNLSPISAPATVTTAGQIDYSSVQVPTVGTVVRRQIIRNTNGSVGAVDPLTGQTRNIAYVDIDTTDLVSTTFSSTRTDPDLATQEQVDVDQASVENGVPPDYKPFLVWHQNRMYLLGVEPYQEGSCSVTFGSNLIQGYNTRWKSNWTGRIMYVVGAPENYVIAGVNETLQIMELFTNYGGTTNPWAEYSVKPVPAEANAFQWSEPNKPESWNPVNVLVLPEDGDRVVGAFNYGSYLYLVKTRHMYRFITRSDPLNDGRVFLAITRGCVNFKSWAVVDETVYMLDTAGIFAFKGDDQGDNISTPIQDMFTTAKGGTGRKINWPAARYIHACHSPNEEIVRWFVPLAGDYVPRHAICYAYKLGKIWCEPLPFRAGSSVLSRIGGRVGTVAEGTEQYYVGSTGGRVLAPLGPAIDGSPQGGTIRGSVTEADDISLTDANASFADGCVNSPVSITEGKGRGQTGYVVEKTSTRLVINTPWRIRPDETSKYCIGGVVFTFASQRIRWLPGDTEMSRGVELEFQPNRVPNKVRVGYAPDFSDPIKMAWDIDRGFRQYVQAAIDDKGQDILLDNPTGYELVQQNSGREGTVPGSLGRTARFVLSGVANEEMVQIGTAILNGMTG